MPLTEKQIEQILSRAKKAQHKLAQAEAEKTAAEKQLRKQFGMDYEEAKQYFNENRKQIQAMRQKLEGLVDEYQRKYGEKLVD